MRIDPMSVPTFLEQELQYIRAEKDGYWSIITRQVPQARELMINSTSMEILQCCSGKSTVSDIIAMMVEKYPNESTDRIEKDVENVLLQYTKLQLVKWQGKNPFQTRMNEEYGDVVLKVAVEGDILEITQFLCKSHFDNREKWDKPSNNVLRYASPIVLEEQYSELSLRWSIFNYYEDIFLAERRGSVTGILAVRAQEYPNAARIVTLIICDVHIFPRLFEYAYRKLPYLCVTPLTKVKILLASDSGANMKMVSELKEIGFAEDGYLRGEYDFNMAHAVYSCEYTASQIKKAQEERMLLQL